MEKEFLTYNQQMRYLRDKKKISCSGSNDKMLLCRNGYFNLVNGYKSPFVTGIDTNGDHVYLPGTSIRDLNELRNFDEELRLLLLKYITRAEEEVRSFSAYKFDEINNMGSLQWYQTDAYDPLIDIKQVVGLISKAYSEISRSKLDYVKFYMDNHKVIPTWILTKVINFSTFIDFLEYSKGPVKNSICELYSLIDSRGYCNYKLLIGSLHWMRKVRNACAHNERVYSINGKTSNGVNQRISDSYFKLLPNSYILDNRALKLIDLFVYLKYYLDTSDYNKMILQVSLMLSQLQSKIHANAFARVRADMGIKDLSHLTLLMTNPKPIEYNKF